MRGILKISYIVDNDSMTDSEFEDQEQKTLIVTEAMLETLIAENVKLNRGDTIDWQYCTVEKI